MSRIIRYLSHPQVEIDPDKDIDKWSLNAEGRTRLTALARSGALAGTTMIVSSGETKAVETAEPLAAALDCPLAVRHLMHENDRSATGFLPPTEFEAVADAFFAAPELSVRGWETAAAAQARIVSEVRICLETYAQGDLLLVGHGGVGTLLYCHLRDVPISRAYDQGPGGGGCYIAWQEDAPQHVTAWQRLERLYTPA